MTFYHGGDLGDIVASLPTVRELSGGDFVIGHRTGVGFGRETMRGARFEVIKPLLAAQPYIHSVSWGDMPPLGEPLNGDIDFSTFRRWQIHGETLANWQARHAGTLVSLAPWLTATPSKKTFGRAVCARSGRYHSETFDWKRTLAEHKKPIFVGTRAEHAAFEKEAGPIEYLPTDNLMELAEAIAGAEIFIGNQSCPFWIAAGLGVSLIQETSPKAPDSMIPRANAIYVR